MEWFRDLSITILGFVTTGVLIFVAIIIYRLYQKTTATLALVQTLVKNINDTVNTMEEMIRTTSQNINDSVTEIKDSIKLVSKSMSDSISKVQESIKPALWVFSIVSGIQKGFNYIKEMFKKELKKEGDENEQG